MKYLRLLWWYAIWLTTIALGTVISILLPGGVNNESSAWAYVAVGLWTCGGICLFFTWIESGLPLNELREARRAKLKVVADGKKVKLIRTAGDGKAHGKVLGEWGVDEAEEAIEKMVEERVRVKAERDEKAEARRMAKRLNKGLKR